MIMMLFWNQCSVTDFDDITRTYRKVVVSYSYFNVPLAKFQLYFIPRKLTDVMEE